MVVIMTDNFYIEDLILSVRKETTPERYLPLAKNREDLLSVMRENNITLRDEISDAVIGQISEKCGDNIARLFARFIHIYDFNPKKLRDIKEHEGREEYDGLAGLLRLPGVRQLRAELYYNSGVTLETLTKRTTEEIQSAVREYIRREDRTEIVPLTKEVNCHREVAKMILHASEGNR